MLKQNKLKQAKWNNPGLYMKGEKPLLQLNIYVLQNKQSLTFFILVKPKCYMLGFHKKVACSFLYRIEFEQVGIWTEMY